MLLDEDSGRSSFALLASPSRAPSHAMWRRRPGAVGKSINDIMQKASRAHRLQTSLMSSHHQHTTLSRMSRIDLHTKLRSATQARALWQVESSGPHPIHGTKRAAGSRDEAVALSSQNPQSPVATGHGRVPVEWQDCLHCSLNGDGQLDCSRCATEDVLLTLFDIGVDIPIVFSLSPRCSPVRSP